MTIKKTISFSIIHFIISFSIAYLLTGDIIIGGLIALLEPTLNTISYFFHEKYWLNIIKKKNLEGSEGLDGEK